MIAFLCPGQGAQKPGFLTEWLEEPDFRKIFLALPRGPELARHGTTSGPEVLRDTSITQPLVVASAITAARVVTERNGLSWDDNRLVLAGHSVGEVAAAALAGVIDDDAAMNFVATRGAAMAKAAQLEPTGMSAVIGGDPTEVEAALDGLGLTAANVNGAGQVVAAGSRTALKQLTENPPGGAKIRTLSVAGAFHSPFMSCAEAELAVAAGNLDVSDPRATLLSNADGAVVRDGRLFIDRLIAQVSHQVRWDHCMSTLSQLGVTAAIELPPAGTLTGLVKRTIPGIETIAMKSPSDLAAAGQLIADVPPAPPVEPKPTTKKVVLIWYAPWAIGTHVVDYPS